MSDHDGKTQIGARIDEDVYDQFKQEVRDNHGGTLRGHLAKELENALRDYANTSNGGDTDDRLRRMENQIEYLVDKVDTVSSEQEAKNKKDSNVGTKTLNRLEEIREQIQRETGNADRVHEAVVRQAIEDNAGHSDPTIRRYKQMLTDRNIIFPHPTNDTEFFKKANDFVAFTNQMTDVGKIPQDRYDEVVDTYGREWWRERLEEIEAAEKDDHDRTFQ